MRTGCRAFPETVGGEGRFTNLQVDFPTTRERRVDYLAVLDRPEGERELIQIEFQATKDARMPKRMLGYCSDVLDWLDERPEDHIGPLLDDVTQKVIYVGPEEWELKPELRRRWLSFGFELINASKLDARPLLEAGDLGDAVVAIPCGDGTDPDVIKAILNKIAQAPANERADALAQLLALAKLRGIRPLIEQEYTAMPITVSVEDIPLLRAPIDRAHAMGKAEGKVEAIVTILSQRFPGQVPAGLADQLPRVAVETLDTILRRSLTAPSVAEALGNAWPMNGTSPKS
jgi:hypothetical protein